MRKPDVETHLYLDFTKKDRTHQYQSGMTRMFIKAALRRAFYAYVYSMQLRFKSNYVGWLKPRSIL